MTLNQWEDVIAAVSSGSDFPEVVPIKECHYITYSKYKALVSLFLQIY